MRERQGAVSTSQGAYYAYVTKMRKAATPYFDACILILLKCRDARKTRRARLFDGSLLSVNKQEKRSATPYFDAYMHFNYSERSATTGSFFAAAFAGIKPLIKVKTMLMTIIVIAEVAGKVANEGIPVKPSKIRLTINAII